MLDKYEGLVTEGLSRNRPFCYKLGRGLAAGTCYNPNRNMSFHPDDCDLTNEESPEALVAAPRHLADARPRSHLHVISRGIGISVIHKTRKKMSPWNRPANWPLASVGNLGRARFSSFESNP